MTCYIIFRAVTAAQLAGDILRKFGIFYQLRRAPKGTAKNGCAYALKCRARDLASIKHYLQIEGVQPMGYWCDNAGKLEEM